MDSGNITEKKTKQQLADFIGINVKTMRNSCRYADNIARIEKNIGEERSKKFDDVVRLCIKNNFFLYSKKEKTPCNKDKINVY